MTTWQRLEVGIAMDRCTVSVTLFAAAMNMLIKSVETSSRRPLMASGIRQPPTQAFMDDMTITSKSVVECRTCKWRLKDWNG